MSRANIGPDHVKRRGSALMRAGGPSLNPGGRVKGVHELIDSLGLGKHCLEAFELVRDCMRGQMKDPANPGAFLVTPQALRIDCAKYLIERRVGRVAASIEVQHGGEVQHRHAATNLGAYSEEELGIMERLLEKGTIDGEIVEPAALPEGLE